MKTMKKKIALISIVAVVGLSLLTLACGNTRADVSNAYVTADTVDELVSRSTVVAVGTITSGPPRRVEIPGKLPGDPSRPDPNYTGVARVYEVAVERYLKGSEDATIEVVQFEGSIVPLGGQVREVQWKSASYPLGAGNRYLLFLIPQGQVPNLWLGTAQPFRFVLSAGMAKAESPAEGILDAFPNKTESALISEVEAIISLGM